MYFPFQATPTGPVAGTRSIGRTRTSVTPNRDAAGNMGTHNYSRAAGS
jgi:hypothetical protein